MARSSGFGGPIADHHRPVIGPPATPPRGYADVPVTAPLTDLEIAKRLPTLSLSLGDPRPHLKGKIREYLPL